jgi:osmotically-inducible protein OsmY
MRYAPTVLALAIAAFGCSNCRDDLDRPSTTEITGAGESRDNALPLDQGQSAEDIETTARIRRMVGDDPSLSTDAKSARIVAKNGVVVLRGPVKNEHERQVIADIARRMPNVVRVDDKLDVDKP